VPRLELAPDVLHVVESNMPAADFQALFFETDAARDRLLSCGAPRWLEVLSAGTFCGVLVLVMRSKIRPVGRSLIWSIIEWCMSSRGISWWRWRRRGWRGRVASLPLSRLADESR
jgi:hypothetical protein